MADQEDREALWRLGHAVLFGMVPWLLAGVVWDLVVPTGTPAVVTSVFSVATWLFCTGRAYRMGSTRSRTPS